LHTADLEQRRVLDNIDIARALIVLVTSPWEEPCSVINAAELVGAIRLRDFR